MIPFILFNYGYVSMYVHIRKGSYEARRGYCIFLLSWSDQCSELP